MNVLKEPQGFILLKRLRVFLGKCVADGFFLKNIITVNGRCKFEKHFHVVGFNEPCINAIVPVVAAKKEVVNFHVTVTYQCATVQLASIKDR